MRVIYLETKCSIVIVYIFMSNQYVMKNDTLFKIMEPSDWVTLHNSQHFKIVA